MQERENLTYYHGSPVAGLTELKPALSEHGKPYIYFATDPLVALLYAVKPVPKPFSYYPYGFEDGIVVYSDYFENSFETLYKGKTGYLYECDNIVNTQQPTQINCAYTCTENVVVRSATEVSDLYQYYQEQERVGKFRIRRFNEIPEKTMIFIRNDMKNTIDTYDLKKFPENPMSLFIREHFPSVWE